MECLIKKYFPENFVIVYALFSFILEDYERKKTTYTYADVVKYINENIIDKFLTDKTQKVLICGEDKTAQYLYCALSYMGYNVIGFLSNEKTVLDAHIYKDVTAVAFNKMIVVTKTPSPPPQGIPSSELNTYYMEV